MPSRQVALDFNLTYYQFIVRFDEQKILLKLPFEAPMRQALHSLQIHTRHKGLIEITAQVSAWVEGQKFTAGLLTIFCRHTSASLLIQENADPDVRADLQGFFDAIAPEDSRRYIHRSPTARIARLGWACGITLKQPLGDDPRICHGCPRRRLRCRFPIEPSEINRSRRGKPGSPCGELGLGNPERGGDLFR
jgi:hypothetical protein